MYACYARFILCYIFVSHVFSVQFPATKAMRYHSNNLLLRCISLDCVRNPYIEHRTSAAWCWWCLHCARSTNSPKNSAHILAEKEKKEKRFSTAAMLYFFFRSASVCCAAHTGVFKCFIIHAPQTQKLRYETQEILCKIAEAQKF